MTQPIPPETIEYERYVDGLRRERASLLEQLRIACRKLQEIGLDHQVPEIPELVGIRAAIAEAAGSVSVKDCTVGRHPPQNLVTRMRAGVCFLAPPTVYEGDGV